MQSTTPRTPEAGNIYTAAVRYRDGSSDLFHVRNADDLADARAMILEQVMNVHAIIIAASTRNA